MVTGQRLRLPARAVAEGPFGVRLFDVGIVALVPSSLPAETDHSAYRILQESLTNVLRHAGPGAAAQVHLRYQPEALTITVTDTGPAPGNGATTAAGGRTRESPASGAVPSGAVPSGAGIGCGVAAGHGNSGHVGSGHGISGMRERWFPGPGDAVHGNAVCLRRDISPTGRGRSRLRGG
jgi:hypothetical protein